MSTDIIRLYDRSRTAQDWKCPRSRYLGYELDNKGITASNKGLELFIGQTLHDGLAVMATRSVGIDDIAQAAHQQVLEALQPANGEVDTLNFAREQAALVEGLLRGFHRAVWPRMMAQYPRIIMIEQELIYDHDGLRFMSKPDLVVADTEGAIWYIEFKSTSSKKEGWINQWDTAIQLHSTIRAIEQTLGGEKVTGVIVQGMYKGYESYGKQSSPFCYSYQRKGTPPFSKDEVRYDYAAGFKRYPTWELQGGVKTWVEGMPETILTEQFPCSPPIFVKEEMVDTWFRERADREQQIFVAMHTLKEIEDPEERDRVLELVFPHNFSACNPGFGAPCPYRRICHGGLQDPLNNGFEYRVPHHQPEAEQQAAGIVPRPKGLSPELERLTTAMVEKFNDAKNEPA